MKRTAPFGEKFVVYGTKDNEKILAGTAPTMVIVCQLIGALYESGYEEITIKDETVYTDESISSKEALYDFYRSVRNYLHKMEYAYRNETDLVFINMSLFCLEKFRQHTDFSLQYESTKKDEDTQDKEYIHLKPVGGCCS